MNHAEYLESHPEYRSLFPTQKMYDDFVRFMEMDKKNAVFSLKKIKRE